MPTSGACHVLAFDSPQFVAHRRRFARLRYIVWGCAGYQGNCDIDDDLVSPVGFSNRQEARQCAAAMTAACEDHCDRAAETVNETPGLEWDGAESYYVATLTLPSAQNLPEQALRMGRGLRLEMVFASRSNRCRRSESEATCSGSTLMATVRSKRVSVAYQTSPIPPSPILAVTAYGPRRAPGETGMVVRDDPAHSTRKQGLPGRVLITCGISPGCKFPPSGTGFHGAFNRWHATIRGQIR